MFARFIYQTLNEKFQEESDPVHDLGIGLPYQIEQWIKTVPLFTRGYGKKEDYIWICAYYGKIDFVKYLIDSGVDIHVGAERALVFACDRNHLEIVKMLLDAGARVYSKDDLCYSWAKSQDVKELLDKHMK